MNYERPAIIAGLLFLSIDRVAPYLVQGRFSLNDWLNKWGKVTGFVNTNYAKFDRLLS